MGKLDLIRPAFALAVFLCGASAAAATSGGAEQQLLAAVEKMQGGDAAGARKTLEDLTRQQPDFRLATQLYGELVASLAGERRNPLRTQPEDVVLRDLAEEAQLRIAGEKAVPPPGYIPNSILQLDHQHPYFIVVDLPKARLYLLQNDKNGQVHLVRDHYAGMGRNGYGKRSTGDLRTPVGVYHITGWKPKDTLPKIYGVGAFPLNYPNLWDQFKQRSGHGIWLHGVPSDEYVRAPRSSEGCVTMANDDLLALKPYITTGETPVILSDAVEWVPPNQAKQEREQFLALIEDWRHRWSARDTDGYLSFYGKDFTTEGMNLARFRDYKRRVNAAKKFIEVKLHNINLFRYPGTDEPMMLAEFTMDYASNNFRVTLQKQQFWRQDDSGHWKIFREENR